jgi:hypothetical protein
MECVDGLATSSMISACLPLRIYGYSGAVSIFNAFSSPVKSIFFDRPISFFAEIPGNGPPATSFDLPEKKACQFDEFPCQDKKFPDQFEHGSKDFLQGSGRIPKGFGVGRSGWFAGKMGQVG